MESLMDAVVEEWRGALENVSKVEREKAPRFGAR
jgi:hypothetical protein